MSPYITRVDTRDILLFPLYSGVYEYSFLFFFLSWETNYDLGSYHEAVYDHGLVILINLGSVE